MRNGNHKDILMCPPTYYNIEYQINPWMTEYADREKARKQWENLKKAFEDLGAHVSLIEPVKYLPDMVFTADQGAVYDHVFIKSNFRHKERKRESLYTLDWFKKQGFAIVELPPDAYFEGQGDLLFLNGEVFIGVGRRTNKKAAEVIGKILGKKLIRLQTLDPYFYHLDTALCVLPNKAVMVYEDAFDETSLRKIRDVASRVISITRADAMRLACNAAVYGNSIVLNKGCSKALHGELRRQGLSVIEVDLSEFLKGGGGAHCLTWNNHHNMEAYEHSAVGYQEPAAQKS